MDGLGLIEEWRWVKVWDAGAGVEKWEDGGCPGGESLTSYPSFLHPNTFLLSPVFTLLRLGSMEVVRIWCAFKANTYCFTWLADAYTRSSEVNILPEPSSRESNLEKLCRNLCWLRWEFKMLESHKQCFKGELRQVQPMDFRHLGIGSKSLDQWNNNNPQSFLPKKRYENPKALLNETGTYCFVWKGPPQP